MLRLLNLGILMVLVGALSCTIVKDSDVTTIDQFNNLKLKSFDIIENDGNLSTYSAVLKFDSIKDYHTPSKFGNYHITRHVAYNLPTLGGRKMQVLGNNNATGPQLANVIYIHYRSDGKPYSFELDAGDSLVAFYRFIYYPSGQLASMRSYVKSILSATAPIIDFKDTIFYNSTSTSNTANNLTGITRIFNKTTSTAFTLSRNASCSSCNNDLYQFSPTGSTSVTNSYQIQSGQSNGGNCDNSSGDTFSCGTLQFNPSNGSNLYLGIQVSQTLGKTSDIILTDPSNRSDLYYFHPLMVLKDVIPQGNIFLWIYATDWWKYNTAGGSNQNNNIVFGATVHLNYGK